MRALAGMKAGNFPFTYLGVPIFVGAPKSRWLKTITDKVIAKMEAWKGHSLSISSHLTLIKSTIYGSLLYSFMIHKWPCALLKYMEWKIRNFLWTGSIASRKLVSVSWDKCCSLLDEGGIALKRLSYLNKALLS